MSDFDSYAHDYQAALHRGLAVSGEDATFFAKERIAWLSRCLKTNDFTPNTILDFGCGTGSATPFFFEILAAQSVVGVDLSAESLTIARTDHAKLAVEYKLTDEYQPPGTIDLAFSNGVFHHIPPTDRTAAVHYIAASLRPGGLFALWENNPWSPAARFVMRRIPFDQDAVMVWPGEARSLLASAGLTILGTDFHFLFPNCLSPLRRLEPPLRRLPLGAQYQVLARKRNAV